MHTPRGRTMTPAQYIALSAASSANYRGKHCESGHTNCAAWNGGPCAQSMRAEQRGRVFSTALHNWHVFAYRVAQRRANKPAAYAYDPPDKR